MPNLKENGCVKWAGGQKYKGEAKERAEKKKEEKAVAKAAKEAEKQAKKDKKDDNDKGGALPQPPIEAVKEVSWEVWEGEEEWERRGKEAEWRRRECCWFLVCEDVKSGLGKCKGHNGNCMLSSETRRRKKWYP